MEEDEIIDVSPVILDFEGFFDKFIEWVEIEIREYLTREVPDGETDSRRSEKETLVPREPLPISSLSFDDTVLRRIVSDDGADEKSECFRILSRVFRIDDIFDHTQKNSSIDGHEKTCDIELQNPCFTPVVIG